MLMCQKCQQLKTSAIARALPTTAKTRTVWPYLEYFYEGQATASAPVLCDRCCAQNSGRAWMRKDHYDDDHE